MKSVLAIAALFAGISSAHAWDGIFGPSLDAGKHTCVELNDKLNSAGKSGLNGNPVYLYQGNAFAATAYTWDACLKQPGGKIDKGVFVKSADASDCMVGFTCNIVGNNGN